ncbi:MAG: trypsin-like peptidase domain-containing protein [Pirellulaceae bacterium]
MSSLFSLLALLAPEFLSTSGIFQPSAYGQAIVEETEEAAIEANAESVATVEVVAENDPSENDLKFLFTGENPQSLDQLRAMQQSVREVYEKVQTCTVNIQNREDGSQGSGVIVSRDGFILTAAHVIGEPGKEVEITLSDSRRLKARTLGVNQAVDSGMLKILNPQETFPYIDLGVSTDLKKGQWVLAIGHPGGLDPNRGMVLRAGRLLTSTSRVLQTDCVLVGGDSGGPLVDMNGDLIGIHSRIGTNLWDNMHVPVDQFSEEWDQLAAGDVIGKKKVPYIGINLVDDTTEIASVEALSPAAEANLKKGDRIIRFNGSEVKSKQDIGTLFQQLKIDEEVDVVVTRDGNELTLKLKIGRKWTDSPEQFRFQ